VLLLNRPYKHESNSDSSCRHSASCFQILPGLMRTSSNRHAWFHPCRYLSPLQVKGSPYIREWIQMEQTVNSGQQEDDPESKDGEWGDYQGNYGREIQRRFRETICRGGCERL